MKSMKNLKGDVNYKILGTSAPVLTMLETSSINPFGVLWVQHEKSPDTDR
jgi:hypothetical protein